MALKIIGALLILFMEEISFWSTPAASINLRLILLAQVMTKLAPGSKEHPIMQRFVFCIMSFKMPALQRA